MTKCKALAAGALMAAFGGVALAAGLYTNGLPTVGAAKFNSVAAVTPNGVVTHISPNDYQSNQQETPIPLVPMDTNRSSGGAPQTVAVFPLGLAATYAESEANTTTSTAGNAVLNTLGALVTTESLSTAVGSTYTFTWTNSLITSAGHSPFAAMYSKSDTSGSPMRLTSTTLSAGVATFVFTNVGTAALNGTMMIVLHI